MYIVLAIASIDGSRKGERQVEIHLHNMHHWRVGFT